MTRDDTTCATCKYFYDQGPFYERGLCRIHLPPWVKESPDERYVDRDYVCDMHKQKEVQA